MVVKDIIKVLYPGYPFSVKLDDGTPNPKLLFSSEKSDPSEIKKVASRAVYKIGLDEAGRDMRLEGPQLLIYVKDDVASNDSTTVHPE